MLQLAVTAHVEVANEIVLADSSLLHGLIRLRSVPASLGRIAGYRFREGQSAGAPAVVRPHSWLHCTSQVCNGSFTSFCYPGLSGSHRERTFGNAKSRRTSPGHHAAR